MIAQFLQKERTERLKRQTRKCMFLQRPRRRQTSKVSQRDICSYNWPILQDQTSCLPSMGVWGSGLLAKTMSTYSICNLSKEPFRPSMMCFRDSPFSVSALEEKKRLVVSKEKICRPDFCSLGWVWSWVEKKSGACGVREKHFSSSLVGGKWAHGFCIFSL